MDRRTGAALLAIAGAVATLAFAPSPASATVTEVTKEFKLPPVPGYAVRQDVQLPAPRPPASGHIVEMSVDLVDGAGDPIPISRLMLHHIVFLNSGRIDQSCQALTAFDNLTSFPGVERFMAAGEERAKMKLPPGYGYDLADQTPGASGPEYWGALYMVMNHKPTTENDAYVQYTMKIDDDPEIQGVVPWWLDVENCQADPIYNVKGTGDPESESVTTSDFQLDADRLGASGGRIVAGGGHVHGGAYRLDLSQPGCDDRDLFSSTPTWGNPDHPFYNVLPVLHEPGPINMTAFRSAEGFPVTAGSSVRLRSVYDDSQPHTRVMGIMIAYVAPDPSVTDPCGELPDDVETLGTNEPGRSEPVPFEVPLTSINQQTGVAETISKPPGKTKRVKSGAELQVRDNYFKTPNVRIDRGDRLSWAFDTNDIHNLTLANGPVAVGSPNLGRDGGGAPRVFTKRFGEPGTYRMFCALHPTQMAERVVVEK